MSAENPLIPFALPADAQFEESPGFLPGPQRHPLKTSLPIFLWLLSSGFLAITALYHVMADGPRAELLSWTASAGAVALLLGATLLARKVWTFTSHRTVDQVSSSLLLMAFVLPSAQLLLTMAVTQDLSYTTYILLLVVGYALLATSAEALLLYTTLCLATWCSCALRGPEVMWVGYVLPWAATVGLSVFIQNRIPLSGLVTSQKTRSSSSVIDVDLAETLREALAERDRALTAKRLAEKEFAEYRVLQDSRIEFLPIVQYLAVQLAQDVSLQEAGPRWLEQLLAPLSAEYGAIWIKAGDQPPKLAVSTSATISSEEQLVHDTLQAGILLQQGSSVGIPLDLGLVGRGVLLVQGAPVLENTMQERYLRTAGALLSLFLRWQQAEVESENHLQHWQQLQEQHRTLQAEFLALQQASKQVQDHFRSQYEAVQQELSTLRSSSCDVNHWKKETERLQQLLETAQTEHDTLTQLLDEAEATIQQLQTQASNSSDVKAFEIRLQVAEAAADTARQQMLKLEQKLKASEAEQMALEKQCDASEQELQRLRSAQARAEEECREVQAEWEREIARVEKLTAAFRTMPEPIALFDTDGVLLCENKPAELLRGNVRLQPGEHPLFELIEPDRFEQKKPWQLPWKHQNIMYQVSITPLLEQKSILGYFITAHNMQEQTQTPVEKAKDESLLAGPRFFAGLAQTLEPPLSQLITHADRLVDVTTDPTIRRQALLGVLQESRLVRRLLTQAIDYSQLEAGLSSPNPGPVAPWQLIQQTVQPWYPVATDKGVELVLHAVGNIPASITSDNQRLSRLIYEMISRAIRTTAHGKVTVKLSLSNQRLRVDVDGALQTSSSSLVQAYESSLLHKQAKVLGAELEEQPSRTSLLLPVTTAELLHTIPSEKLTFDEPCLSSPADPEPLSGKVLLVLDGQENQRVCTYQLERLGLRCEVVEPGLRALDRAREERFDIIVWDAAKRDLSLLAGTQRLRSQYYQGAILALGPLQPGSTWDAFQSAGGDALLQRPIVLANWRHLLASYLPQSNARLAILQDSLYSEYQSDREFYPLLRNYVLKLPGQLAEMKAALQVADIARLIQLSHALADNSMLYGYPELQKLAHRLEQALLAGSDAPVLNHLVNQLHAVIQKVEAGIVQSPSHASLRLPGSYTKAA